MLLFALFLGVGPGWVARKGIRVGEGSTFLMMVALLSLKLWETTALQNSEAASLGEGLGFQREFYFELHKPFFPVQRTLPG